MTLKTELKKRFDEFKVGAGLRKSGSTDINAGDEGVEEQQRANDANGGINVP